MSVVQIIVVTFSCIIFFGRLFFGIFKRFSPFKKKFPEDEETNNGANANIDSDPSSPDAKGPSSTVRVETGDGAINLSDNDIEMIGETDQEQETGDGVQTTQPTSSILSGLPRNSISNILEEDIRPFSTNPKLRLAKGNSAEMQSVSLISSTQNRNSALAF